MKKFKINFLTGIVLTALLLVTNAFPQNGTRIKFRRGSYSATVSGTVARGGPDFWIVGARAGQRMTVRVRGNVTFGLDSGRGTQMTEDDSNKSWRQRLDFDGDQTIRVYSTGGVQKYSLTVTVR